MIQTGKRIKIKRRVKVPQSSANYNSNYDMVSSSHTSSPSQSQSHHIPQYNIYASSDVATEDSSSPTSASNSSELHILDDYSPNQLLLRNLNYIPQQLNKGDLRHLHSMSENSYSDQTSTYSNLQSAIIRNMAKSVLNETSAMFDIQGENEYRPYEEQINYQSSRVGSSINRQMAKNITSKYSRDDD